MPAPLLPIIAGAVAAGGSIWDRVSGNRTARRNVDMTIAANKRESELAYQRSLQTWNMQNEYNSPQAQMQRFKAAGLNPHLIYGQGTAGLASPPANYSPPDIQYRYEAPAYGGAMNEALPMLMAVGSWMQDMRLTDAQLKKTNVETARSATEIERTRQLVDFMIQRNPQILEEGKNRLSLYPYQRDAARYTAGKAYQSLADMEADYRFKYGDALWSELAHDAKMPSQSAIGGKKKLEFLQEQSKTKLLDAKSSWSEFDITDPQQIMMAVLGAVAGLAGQTLRLSTHKGPKSSPKRERPRGLNPRRMGVNHPDRRR